MADKLDTIIKTALDDEANLAGNTESIYPVIKNRLNGVTAKKVYLINFKKPVSAFVFYSLVIAVLFFGFSGQTKAVASEAVKTIKTFFVLQKKGPGLKVEEMPVNKVELSYSVSRTTFSSDDKLEELLGFKSVFPQTIQNKYTLYAKSAGVSLDKKLKHDTYMGLQDTMLKAIEDNSAFESLEEYGPHRNITGFYQDNESSLKVFIGINPLAQKVKPEKAESQEIDSYKVTRVDVNGYEGQWAQFPVPIYPFINQNGVGSSDMTKPPVEIKKCYSLSWTEDNLRYTISFNYLSDSVLSKKETIELAEEFSKAQAR